MLFSGIEDSKRVSIDYNPLKKSWKLSTKIGKKIYVIPSDRVLVKKEKLPQGIEKPSQLRKYLSVKYGRFLFDFELLKDKGFYYLVLVKNFQPPEDYYALEPEPFALARLSFPVGEPNLQILDIGRRKTTYVEVENNRLKTYRVVLKGTNYLSEEISKRLNISPERAKELLTTEGCNLDPVKRALEEILSQIPLKGEIPLLLSGGGGELKGLENLLKVERIVDLKLVDKELYSPLGAALKFVYPSGSPPFKRAEVSLKDLQIFALSSLTVVGVVFLFNLFTGYLKSDYLKRLKLTEEKLFKEKYPDLPPVEVVEQLKSLKAMEGKSVLPLLDRALSSLPKGVKIYKLLYKDGRLVVKGEASKSVLGRFKNLVKVKELENNRIAFEVAVQ